MFGLIAQKTIGTNVEFSLGILKGYIWNSKEDCISVSKKWYITGVNGLMIEGR